VLCFAAKSRWRKRSDRPYRKEAGIAFDGDWPTVSLVNRLLLCRHLDSFFTHRHASRGTASFDIVTDRQIAVMPRSSKRTAASMDASESSRRIKFSRGSTAQRSQTTNNHTIQEEPEDEQPSESGAGETVKEEAETAVKVSAKIKTRVLQYQSLANYS
jgi:hypothetical protein